MALLIKNARVFAPKDLGVADVLMANERILAVGPDLDPNLPDLQTIDAKGMILTPGFFDQHIHVTGGGGEGVPQPVRLNFSSLNSLNAVRQTSWVSLVPTIRRARFRTCSPRCAPSRLKASLLGCTRRTTVARRLCSRTPSVTTSSSCLK